MPREALDALSRATAAMLTAVSAAAGGRLHAARIGAWVCEHVAANRDARSRFAVSSIALHDEKRHIAWQVLRRLLALQRRHAVDEAERFQLPNGPSKPTSGTRRLQSMKAGRHGGYAVPIDCNLSSGCCTDEHLVRAKMVEMVKL